MIYAMPPCREMRREPFNNGVPCIPAVEADFANHTNLKGTSFPIERGTFRDGEKNPVRGKLIHSTGQGNLHPLSNSGGLQDTFS